MNKASGILFLTLGTLAGIMDIEHGIGEVLVGYRPTDSLFIQSWTNFPAKYDGPAAPAPPRCAPISFVV